MVQFPEWSSRRRPTSRAFEADPLNLFLIVESGDHHVTVLDGDSFEPIHRFKSRHALHGGPKYSSDGRYVYFASRDGWVSKFDMYTLKTVAEVRAGINTRNLAVSADDRYVLVGNYLPHTLVLLDASDLTLIKVMPVEDDHGKSSRVSAVYTRRTTREFYRGTQGLQGSLGDQLQRQPRSGLSGLRARLQDGRGSGRDRRSFRFGASSWMTIWTISSSTHAYEHLIGASRKGDEGAGGEPEM